MQGDVKAQGHEGARTQGQCPLACPRPSVHRLIQGPVSCKQVGLGRGGDTSALHAKT